MPLHAPLILLTVVGALALLPSTARAQAFGIGPRFSFVEGALSTGAPATRFYGGTIRMASGKHTVSKGSMDYRTYYGLTSGPAHRETPIQGSLLLFPSRGNVRALCGRRLRPLHAASTTDLEHEGHRRR